MKTFTVAVSLALVLFVAFVATACMPRNPPYLPPGVWKSEYPVIILYFDENYQVAPRQHPYLGIYMREGEEVRVFAPFHGRSPVFMITSASSGRIQYYRGRFRVVGYRMYYYNFDLRTQERTGLTQIIFHRVFDYPPINPEDWFPTPTPTPNTAGEVAP